MNGTHWYKQIGFKGKFKDVVNDETFVGEVNEHGFDAHWRKDFVRFVNRPDGSGFVENYELIEVITVEDEINTLYNSLDNIRISFGAFTDRIRLDSGITYPDVIARFDDEVNVIFEKIQAALGSLRDQCDQTSADEMREGFRRGRLDGLKVGRAEGFDIGHTYGYNEGHSAGYHSRRNDIEIAGEAYTAYQEGFDDGRLQGIEEREHLMDDAFDCGHVQGIDDGYDAAFNDGYDDGYDVGYDDHVWGCGYCGENGEKFNPDKVAIKALAKWGSETQIDMFIEEASEAIVALEHYRRGRNTMNDVIKELADTQVTLDQMKILFGRKDTLESEFRTWKKLETMLEDNVDYSECFTLVIETPETAFEEMTRQTPIFQDGMYRKRIFN